MERVVVNNHVKHKKKRREEKKQQHTNMTSFAWNGWFCGNNWNECVRVRRVHVRVCPAKTNRQLSVCVCCARTTNLCCTISTTNIQRHVFPDHFANALHIRFFQIVFFAVFVRGIFTHTQWKQMWRDARAWLSNRQINLQSLLPWLMRSMPYKPSRSSKKQKNKKTNK